LGNYRNGICQNQDVNSENFPDRVIENSFTTIQHAHAEVKDTIFNSKIEGLRKLQGEGLRFEHCLAGSEIGAKISENKWFHSQLQRQNETRILGKG
jgi:hypothetical protein